MKEEISTMNEQRLVTLILVVVLALGSAGLVAFYFSTSGGQDGIAPAPSGNPPAVRPGHKKARVTPSKPPAVPPVKDIRAEDKAPNVSPPATKSPPKETVSLPVRPEETTPLSAMPEEKASRPVIPEVAEPPAAKEETPSFPEPAPDSGAAGPEEKAEKQSIARIMPQTPPQITIQEMLKPNGSFKKAQSITEGIITGKRGSAGDLSDYYKIRATGSSMILRLEPSMSDEKKRFDVIVFDPARKKIGGISAKTGPSITLDVTSRTVYYIKLDLSRGPIRSPQYQLHVRFD